MTATSPDNLRPTPLLDAAALATVHAILGKAAPADREDLAVLLRENAATMIDGGTEAMAATLARQAATLEAAMNGLLSVMSSDQSPGGRLALARAAATLHKAGLRTLSALHQINKDAKIAARRLP